MKAFLVVFHEDRDAEAFTADLKAREAPGGSTRLLVDYGDSWPEMGRDAPVTVTAVDPGTVTRPGSSGRPERVPGPGQD